MSTAILSPIQLSRYQGVSQSVRSDLVDQAYLRGFHHFTSTVVTETFAAKFYRLTQSWKDATRFSSTYQQLLANPSYLELIAMGEKILPFIFTDMQREASHWFMALHILTGMNPVKPENRGNIQLMTHDWLEWAKSKGYVAG
jgi:hypothetical protein